MMDFRSPSLVQKHFDSCIGQALRQIQVLPTWAHPPLMPPPENDGTTGIFSAVPTEFAITPSSVLVVDDESAIASSMVYFLRPHQVEHTVSGRLALQYLQSKKFDIILCDLLMPEMSGIELYHAVTKIWPELGRAFVFMTGGVTSQETRTFLENAENIRVAKPFSRNEIMFAIETQLHRPMK